jgi:hypothetical protein
VDGAPEASGKIERQLDSPASQRVRSRLGCGARNEEHPPASQRPLAPPGLTSEERARREGGAVKGDGEVGGGRRRAGQQSERDNRASGTTERAGQQSEREDTAPLARRRDRRQARANGAR